MSNEPIKPTHVVLWVLLSASIWGVVVFLAANYLIPAATFVVVVFGVMLGAI